MPFIGCIIPSDQVDACKIHTWEDSTPEIGGQNQKVFWNLNHYQMIKINPKLLKSNFDSIRVKT